METFLTRAMTIVALTCFLVVGAAATSILGRDSVPLARFELASVSRTEAPVANRESKKDKLAVVSQALAAFDPRASEPVQADPALNESLRRAYASTSPADLGVPQPIEVPQAIAPSAAPAISIRRWRSACGARRRRIRRTSRRS